MKQDEFNKYVKDLATNLECQTNTSAINRYNPTMFEDFSKASSSDASADTAN